jgi:hypothetical protein
MTWVKLSDDFPQNPKVIGLSTAAKWRYVNGLCYAAQYKTDGVIAAKAIRSIASAKVKRELLEAGLWHETAAGVQIHDFLTYNPSRAQLDARREQGAARVKDWRARNADVTPLHANGNAVGNAAPVPDPVPLPEREVVAVALDIEGLRGWLQDHDAKENTLNSLEGLNRKYRFSEDEFDEALRAARGHDVESQSAMFIAVLKRIGKERDPNGLAELMVPIAANIFQPPIEDVA